MTPLALRARPGRTAMRRFMILGALVSLGIHAAAMLALLPNDPGPLAGADAPTLEIELVQQPPQAQGQPAAQPASTESSQARAAPPAVPMPAGPSADASGGVPMPPPYAPARVPMPPGPPAAARTPVPPAEVDLGAAAQDLAAMTVEGKDVVLPKPDARHRNLPPVWPPELARRQIGGRLSVLLHIGPDGKVQRVELVQSSGQPGLDRAAIDAAKAWHFSPARRGGVAVPFDWPYTISFVTGNG